MPSGRSVLLAIFSAASTLNAQQPVSHRDGRHSIVGIVVDSLRGRPLAGAQVILDGTIHSALSDSSGLFRLDSIPNGDYNVGFFHPMLDSMAVSIPARALRVPLDSGKAIVLAVPSSRTLVAALCPGNVGNGTSVLAGLVADPETETGIAGATVRVKWTDIEVSKESGVMVSPREYVAKTDNAGVYRICGLPGDFDARVSALIGNVATADVPVESHSPTVMTRSLTLMRDPQSAAHNASVSGIVRSPDRRPLEGARIMLPGTTSSVRSDKQGRFSLGSLPSGTQSLLVQRIGFRPTAVPVELSSRVPATVDVVMGNFATTIDTVYVRERRNRDLASVGFLQRQKRGIGDYRTRADFEKLNPRYLSDILRTMRGVTVHYDGAQTIIGGRGFRTSCVQVIVDHVPWPLLVAGDLDDMIFPNDVAAIEVYDGPGAPPEFSIQSCLTMVIWTRARIRNG